MTDTITITRNQLATVLRDYALTVTGDGRANDVFDALAALSSQDGGDA